MGWISLLPVGLTDAEKRCLETIEQLGEYIPNPWSSVDLDALNDLETRNLLTTRREYGGGPTIYKLTETGKLWLKRCTENTGEYELSDEVTALFNSFDEATKRQFTVFAAMQIGMELHPEAEKEDAE